MAGKSSKVSQSNEVELEPDAWERFERFIKKAAKTPPKHRSKKEAAPESGPRIKKRTSRSLQSPKQ